MDYVDMIKWVQGKLFHSMRHMRSHLNDSDIPIVQVNVFGSLNTLIMTVLVDLYQLMGAAMLVCAES